MELLKIISKEEIQTKPLIWYKEQYIAVFEEINKKKLYCKDEERILNHVRIWKMSQRL